MVVTTVVHLPNGQTLTASPIFGGVYFRSNDLTNFNHHHCPFPPGWSVVLNTEEEIELEDDPEESDTKIHPPGDTKKKKKIIHPYRHPTLNSDRLFISSISNPPSSDFKPASSQSRQIAMMLWATLYWYFHQAEPEPQIETADSKRTHHAGKPKGEWRIRISRDGVFKGRVVLPKLERMGLIASLDSAVGVDRDERAGEGWLDMFVSRRSFWQLDARIYLFTLAPGNGSPFAGGTPIGGLTPAGSRPNSPSRQAEERKPDVYVPSGQIPAISNVLSGTSTPLGQGTSSPGPFTSASHLPTFYPPPPPQITVTDGVRHPVRPKPGKQGEVLYTRYIPSFKQYLSFRIASANPIEANRHSIANVSAAFQNSHRISLSDTFVPTMQSLHLEEGDVNILHKWMNIPRVSEYWFEDGPTAIQEAYLKRQLKSKHSIPIIGCWDGKPFGYFEVYWVKEDALGRMLGDVGNYDRGIHCLVGENEFRGPERVKVWLSSLLHYCWLADNRTEIVMMEPRVDHTKLLHYCREAGFYKEKEITFPHKQSNLLKIRRDAWEAPAV